MPGDQPSQELIDALKSLINTETPAARKNVLKEHSQLLLDSQLLPLLENNIKRNEDLNDFGAVEVFKHVKWLIETGINKGLDYAINMLDRQQTTMHINEMISLEYPALFKYLEKHKDLLLSPLAGQILDENLERMKGAEGFEHLSFINTMIKIARNENIENAKDWFKNTLIGNMVRALKEQDYAYCKNAIEISLAIAPKEMENATKENLGSILISECDLKKDLDWIRKLIQGPLLVQDSIDRIRTLDILFIQKLCLSAEKDHLEEGIRLYREMENKWNSQGYKIRGINGAIGNAYLILHLEDSAKNQQDPKLDEAIKFTELEIAEAEPNSENWRRGLRTIGHVYQLKGNIPKAIENLEKATEVEPQEIDDLYADAKYQLSKLRPTKNITNRRQEVEKSINDLENGLKHATSMTWLWGSMNRDLGNIYREYNSGNPTRDFKASLYYTEQAEVFFNREEHPNEWGRIQHNLGTLYYTDTRGDRSANMENAIAAYKRTLEVHTKKENQQYYGLTNCALGLAFLNRVLGNADNNASLALKHLKEAEATLNPEDSKQWLGDCYNGMAAIYLNNAAPSRKENLVLGLEYLEKARNNYQANGNRDRELDTMNNMNKAYSDLLDFDIGFAEKATENSLFILRSIKKEDDPFRWANYVRNHAVLLFNINRVTGRGSQYTEILNYLSESLSVYNEETYLQEYHNTLIIIGHIYFLRTDWAKSLDTYTKSIRAGEILLLSTFTEDGRKKLIKETELAHNRAAYCLVKLYRYEEAILMIETSKARLLGDTLAHSGTDDVLIPESTRTKLSTLLEKINSLELRMRQSVDRARSDITSLAEDLAATRNSLRETADQIRLNHPYFGQRLTSFKEIAEEIPEGGALIAFLATTAGGYAIVLPDNRSGIDVNNIVELPALTLERVERFLNSENSESWVALLKEVDELHDPKEFLDWLNAFYSFMNANWENVIKPVRERLNKFGVPPGSKILFLPQGCLWLLALHAASWVENDQIRSFNDDFIVSYTPSLFISKICNARLAKKINFQKSLLAVGDSAGDLPFARDEISLISSNFTTTMIPSKEEATGKKIIRLANEVSFIHFACHGTYNWSNVMRSGILIGNNEILELSTILSKLNLENNRLVTLSACESGITDLKGSADEFVGLPTGFVLAGATAVFSSLWRVEDSATCLIMDALYDEMIQKNQSPAIALYNAQHRLRNMTVEEIAKLKKPDGEKIIQRFKVFFPEMQSTERLFDHPYFWAGFTLIGS